MYETEKERMQERKLEDYAQIRKLKHNEAYY